MNCKPCNKSSTVTGTLNVTDTSVQSNITNVPKVKLIPSTNHCPDNAVKKIGKVGNKIIITMDDCTFYQASLDKIDLASFNKIATVITDIQKVDNKLVITKTNQLTGEIEQYEIE